MILEIGIFALSTLIVYYIYSYKKLQYYLESNDVKFLPGWPLFGNTLHTALQKRHMFEDIDVVYKAFPNERYVGLIENTKLTILIRDPELIKLTTVKDFDHFTDHKPFFDENLDPLFGASLLLMKGEKWRDMRTTLSPAFTGSKMRHMMQFILEISNNFIQHLLEDENTSKEIQVEELMRRYTNDVIASASFGLQVNSLEDRHNEFFTTGQNIMNFDFRQLCFMFLSDQFPWLCKKLDLKLRSKKMYNFFMNIVTTTIKHRKANNFHRPDMIQLLMETSKDWTPKEITAQAFIFFAAGFETSASMLVLCIHELANHPGIQERLYQEIREFKEKHGELSSDNMPELKYLDCVVSETLRIWSPAIVIDRQCVKTYELPPPREGGKPYTINPGELIYNSCNSLHLDPQYFPDPLKFDPDRFSDENKHKIKPFTFMPFGVGPRNCIGIRFAFMEIKALIFDIMLHFKIQKCSKTSDPIELVNFGFNMRAKGGTWVKFEKRV